ncbi:copper resistance CopC/CopD family protein [Falsirhodobacter xinxiangensis]|uniref:copper resistance CopC/CopD family protein n=1 Tax=Falsirhodobacter xinxiangensis TaxID=2530049 RepID=UPI0010AA8C61|nr:CopD family protein [Rhodobacter xinxiangensis]
MTSIFRCAILLLVLCSGAAHGHAALMETDPADGAILDAGPDAVNLHFDSPVRPLVARVTKPDGTTHTLPAATLQGNAVSWALRPLQQQGSHLISWRVTAEDGHPLAGGTLFSIGAPSQIRPVETAAPLPTRLLLWAARSILLSALLVGAGAAAFGLLARSARNITNGAAAVGLVALPVVALTQGLELLGLPLSAVATAAPWREAVTGPSALALLLAGATFAALLFARHRAMVILALLATTASAAVAGHAATAPPQMLMRPAIALHVLAAALWIGALPVLAIALRTGGGAAALRRFSQMIPWGLGVLLASGCAIAVVQVEQPAALWATAYGRVLLAKLTLVAALLALALWNRHRLTGLAMIGRHGPLVRSIGAELVLAVLIVGTLASWRFTPPPRSLIPPPAELRQPLASGAITGTLVLNSDRAGPVAARLEDLRLDGAPLSPLAAEVTFAKPAYGLGPLARRVEGDGSTTVEAGTFVLPMDGFWVLTVMLTISDFRAEKIMDIVTLAPSRP